MDKQPRDGSRNSPRGHPLNSNNPPAPRLPSGLQRTMAQRDTTEKRSTLLRSPKGKEKEGNPRHFGEGLARQHPGVIGEQSPSARTPRHVGMSTARHATEAIRRTNGRLQDMYNQPSWRNDGQGTLSYTAQPTAMSTSQHGYAQATQFLNNLGEGIAGKQEESGPSSGTTSAVDGMVPDESLWGPLNYKKYGRGNGNPRPTPAPQPQHLTNRGDPQITVHRATTVNLNMGGFNNHPPSSDHGLRQHTVGKFLPAFPSNTRPQHDELADFSLADYNERNRRLLNPGAQVSTTRPSNHGGYMANSQAPNMRASGIQGRGLPPAMNQNNGTSNVPYYNGSAHGNFGGAQNQHHSYRQTPFGSNATMATTGHNSVAGAAFTTVRRTRQNNGTANGPQGMRKVSNETNDSQPFPERLTKEEMQKLEGETMKLIRGLRERDQSDIYLAFYGNESPEASNIRQILAEIENNIIRLGVFNVGVPGLFSWFPILQRNPAYQGKPNQHRLSDWNQGVKVDNIASPGPTNAQNGELTQRYATYEDYLLAMNIPDANNANHSAGEGANMAVDVVGKSNDHFQPSYSKTGNRPQSHPVLLLQAYITGVDLTNFPYKGSISQKMIRNMLTPGYLNCAVFIKAVNPSVTDQDIFNTFEDPVYSYYKKQPIEGKHPDCAVTVVFMDRAAAQRYMDKGARSEIILGGRARKAVWSRDHACPAEPFELSQSRVLKIRETIRDADFEMSSMIQYLQSMIDFGLVFQDQAHDMENGMREIVLHFHSIRGQSRAAKVALERKFGHSITMEYEQDPCGIIPQPYAVGPPRYAALPAPAFPYSNWSGYQDISTGPWGLI